MLPSVSVKIFSTFSCTHFEGDYGSYLKADFSLDCTTSKHRWYMVYAALMVFIYPIGVPYMYYRLLVGPNGTVRERLRCEQDEKEHLFGREEGKAMAMAEREQNVEDDESLKKLEFLYKMYEPKAWWFEVFETGRRLMLTGGIIFLNPGTASQVVMSMVICLGAMRVYAGVKPFISPKHDVLAEAAQWQLFFTMFAALAIKVQLDDESLQDRTYFDVAIIVLQFLAPSVLLVQHYLVVDMEDDEAERVEGGGGGGGLKESCKAFLRKLRKRLYKKLVKPFVTLKKTLREEANMCFGGADSGNDDGGPRTSGTQGGSSIEAPRSPKSPRSKLRALSEEQQKTDFLRQKYVQRVRAGAMAF
jgi:hypothetical protein